MNLIQSLMLLILVYVSYLFMIKFSKEENEELITALQLLDHYECPTGMALFRLKTDSHLYRIQVQSKLPHDPSVTFKILKRCETFDYVADEIDDSHVVDGYATEQNKLRPDEYEPIGRNLAFLVGEACSRMVYTTEECKLPVSNGRGHNNNNLISRLLTSYPALAYWLEVVKGDVVADTQRECPKERTQAQLISSFALSWNKRINGEKCTELYRAATFHMFLEKFLHEDGFKSMTVFSRPDTLLTTPERNSPTEWSFQTLIRGIFPGTLWCGFGNMADDTYGQLGDQADVDDCCRSHDLCKPIIKAFEKRYYFSNPSVVPISHCGCDMRLYNCLRKVNSQTSNTIGKIFFNVAKMKCFDFDVRKVCNFSVLGLCWEYSDKCVAILKNNKMYPTYMYCLVLLVAI